MSVTLKKWDIYIKGILVGLNAKSGFPVVAVIKPSTLQTEGDVTTVVEIGDSLITLVEPQEGAPIPKVVNADGDVTTQMEHEYTNIEEMEDHLLSLGNEGEGVAAIDELGDQFDREISDFELSAADQHDMEAIMDEADEFLAREEEPDSGHSCQTSG